MWLRNTIPSHMEKHVTGLNAAGTVIAKYLHISSISNHRKGLA